jgi:2-polyprenyl-3-methyl-5-hydroxy-6-metoxy-1,4-benzoquinol methylase
MADHHHRLPDGFVADLRRGRAWTELEDTLWRSPDLVALTYGRLWDLVAAGLPATPARVLDVGSGTGVLTLELARAGHDVVGIEPDVTSIALARRSVAQAGAGPGRLTYHQAEVESWDPDGADFDVVVTTRALHHVADPAVALARMRDWLAPGGRLVVVDFLHDLFDRRAAQWMAQARALLEAAGMFRLHAHAHAHAHDGDGDGDHGDGDDRLPAEPEAAVRRVEADWRREHEHEEVLNRAAEILDPLDELFDVSERSWHPYLYWDVLAGLRSDDSAVLRRVATRLADWEQHLLDAGTLPGVLVRAVATAR